MKRVLPPGFKEWFCEEYASTAETIEQVLRRAPAEFGKLTLSKRTLYGWRVANKEFDAAYRIAQQAKGTLCLDEAQHEAEKARMGTITTEGERAGKSESMTKTVDNVERSKLICTALWKRAMAFDPSLRDNGQIEAKVSGVVLVHSVPQPPKEEKACQPTDQ